MTEDWHAVGQTTPGHGARTRHQPEDIRRIFRILFGGDLADKQLPCQASAEEADVTGYLPNSLKAETVKSQR